jgi:hypothetical protein
MTEITSKESSFNDVILLKLAREVAMDMRDIPQILELHGVTQGEWEVISTLPRFQDYLRSSLEEWNSAANTADRVKLKSLAFVEEALPEFFARAHDPREALPAKVEVLKAVARFAGVGGSVDAGITGERLSVTINLGADQQLKIEKNITPQGNVIEGELG